MGCSRIAPLTPVVMVIRRFTCHHVILSGCMSGLHLISISLWVVFENMSCQWVNFMSMTSGGVGIRGGWLSMWAPNTYSIFGLSLVRHVHGIVGHVHQSIHYWTHYKFMMGRKKCDHTLIFIEYCLDSKS